MNQFHLTQQNQITIQNPNNGTVYFLYNKRFTDHNLDRYEGEIKDTKSKILCDCLKQFSDQFMRCLDELISNPQENIIKYQDFFIDPYNKLLYVIYEYVDKESFLNYQLQNLKLDEKQKYKICNDVSKGIYYLHLISYRHRNINPENICFAEGQYKITHLNYVVHFVMKDKLDVVGNSCYWSQELLLNNDYNHTIDIFAFACVAFEIFTLQKLFTPQDDRQRIPVGKMQEFQKLPVKIQQFINLVIVQGQRDLKPFLENQAQLLENQKKQASQIGQQQFSFEINKKYNINNMHNINNNNNPNNINNLNNQTNLNTLNNQNNNLQPFQINQFRDQKRPSTVQNFNQAQFAQNKISNQPKQPDAIVQSSVPQQQVQFQSLQNQQHQNTFVPFQLQPQQDRQQQPIQRQITPLSTTDAKPKIPAFPNPINEIHQVPQMLNQQFQFNLNFSPPILLETSQNFHQKKSSYPNLNDYDQNQDIFKCQIDTSKEEREREQQKKNQIFNEVQKYVKVEQQQKLATDCYELNKQSQDLSIEEMLEKIIKKRVQDNLSLTIV
ncbi:unnamed protein product [Paramecium pentaurelia]|uniref:Protein kinase domain-containing protein n=1 Tax=Paramecium pentaurelia TaxID=43138 RepID=A0A8S1X9K0_9CILI|nr:unnamed protein product [Paramecium pentaurelia]